MVAASEIDGDAVAAAVGLADALGLAETIGLADADAIGDAAPAPEALATTEGIADALGDSDGKLGDSDGKIDSLGTDVAHSGVGLGDGSGVGRGVNAPPWPNASTYTRIAANTAMITPTQIFATGSSI